MSTGEWQENEEPEIGARHLLLCREVIWNANDPEAHYSLHGLLTTVRPRGDFPLTWDKPMYAFAQFYGQPGEYEVWIEEVRLVQDDLGEIVDEDEPVAFGPFVVTLDGPYFVHGRAFFLRKVPFTAPGLYEFRLRVAGLFNVVIAERLLVEG